jgi:hypothetical protein
VFAVTGPRGAGKSQLAAACARRRLDAGWRVVAWLNAEDREQLLGGFAELATALGLSDGPDDSATSATRVRRWLQAEGTRCLLVLDNATNADLIRPFLPAAGQAHVIITSSHQAITSLGIPILVEAFTPDQATAYLTERTGRADHTGVGEVGEELGYLPLALAQAAAVIAGQRLDYSTYLRRLAEIPVADYLTRSEGDPYPRGTAEAIMLSVEAAQRGEDGTLCRQVLDLLCLLSPAGIPRSLLTSAVGAPDVTVDRALQLLVGWSLLNWSSDGSAVIAHRLVMRVLRERMSGEGTLPAAAGRAIAGLRTAMPPAKEEWPDRRCAREVVEQIIALAGNLAPYAHVVDGEPEAELLLLQGWAGWYLTTQKDFSRAIPLLENAVAGREKLWGPDDQATRTARNNLATAYLLAGRVNDAIPLHEQNLADAERAHGSDQQEALSARGNLASAYQQAGRLTDAMPLLKRNAADSERLLGLYSARTLAAVNNLAIGYRLTGHLDRAIRLHKQNLARRLKVLGPDHAYTLTARNNPPTPCSTRAASAKRSPCMSVISKTGPGSSAQTTPTRFKPATTSPTRTLAWAAYTKPSHCTSKRSPTSSGYLAQTTLRPCSRSATSVAPTFRSAASAMPSPS